MTDLCVLGTGGAVATAERDNTAFALDLGRLAQEADVPCLIPCHFFGEAAFNAAEVEEEIRRHDRGRLIIPEDLQRISLIKL